MCDYTFGIDIGSVSVNTIVINKKSDIIYENYTRFFGSPVETAISCFEKAGSFLGIGFSANEGVQVGFTGSGTRVFPQIAGGVYFNEIVCHAEAIRRMYPAVRTIIDMGGEDSKLITLRKEQNNLVIADFSMNSLCAAGTGSFLDQQANRLGYSIQAFAGVATESKSPARIAGRCSVFAKSDMIHLQQIATPEVDIIAGLCYALVKSFKSNIVKNRTLDIPIAFHGGVAANKGARKALAEVFGITRDQLFIPSHFRSMGAIGAAYLVRGTGNRQSLFQLNNLIDFINRNKSIEDMPVHSPLERSGNIVRWGGEGRFPAAVVSASRVEAYLGIDVGSISTNLVVIDKNLCVLAERYLMTEGKPIEIVLKGLKEIGEEIGSQVVIKAVGTTGSGRYLIGGFVGADVVKNEITAQATAAIAIDKKVDTIFEIGGQDSKYIGIENGLVVDFEMNKVCAAGTGSFLEEQAEKLGVSIKGEFSQLALSSTAPIKLGERCTVFMESSLLKYQQWGAPLKDLIGGLCYSIAENYLNRVVGNKKIGDRIFFQGGVAYNEGVVAAFRNILGKDIIVPPYHHITGAIGAAILAKRESKNLESNFKGFDLSSRHYSVSTFECKGCSNACRISKVSVEGDAPLFYGSRCEKYDVVQSESNGLKMTDYFEAWRKIIFADYPVKLPESATKIWIPRALMFYLQYPFWNAFFRCMGIQPLLSGTTDQKIIEKGIECVVTEPCLPVKIAHGHIASVLEEKDVEWVFVPSVVQLPKGLSTFRGSHFCPYVQSLPYLIRACPGLERFSRRLLVPVISFDGNHKTTLKDLSYFCKVLGITRSVVKDAFEEASLYQAECEERLKNLGKDALESQDAIMFVLVGRPYNVVDPGANLDLPRKLRKLGVNVIPMDMMTTSLKSENPLIQKMYWLYGQKILQTAEAINRSKNLYGIYVSNFGCGPDSFILHYFREIMRDKPFLHLEIDEHSADAGVVTRCEAFLDSVNNFLGNITGKHYRHAKRLTVFRQPAVRRGMTMYIPHMSDHAYALASAFRSCGLDATVFPEADENTVAVGKQHTTGRECFPCILTTGEIIKILDNTDNTHNLAFFMPTTSGPCRFGQYSKFQRQKLDELGYSHVPIFCPNQDMEMYTELNIVGSKFKRRAWEGVVAVDLLIKLVHQIRPYEIKQGVTDECYKWALGVICDAIEKEQSLQVKLHEIRDEMKAIKIGKTGKRPLIGVVGEIYLRSNSFSNENVIRKIEALGGEVFLSPVSEWISYVNEISRLRAAKLRCYRNWLQLQIEHGFQKWCEHRFTSIFAGVFENLHEPTLREIFRLSLPYIHYSFEGEAILSIGRALDMREKGVAGILNIMPFTCMPGTIVTALFEKFRRDRGDVPVLSLVYDGNPDASTDIKLEAFIHQAHQGTHQAAVS